MVPSGTVVMALAGQGKTRGTVAITNIDLCTNQSLAAIVTDDTVCDLCLLYYLETQYENLRAVSSGDGTRGGLNLQIIADYPVCLPSVDEQIKIADFFAVLDRKIDKQRALIDSLKKYKRGLLQRILRYDNGWEEVSLSDVLFERKTYCEKDGTYEHATLSKEGVYGKTDRYDRDYLVMDEEKKYKITHLGDLCYNPANLKFGVICLNTYGDAIFSPIYITFEIAEKYNKNFIGLLLTRTDFINHALKYQQGTVYERMAVSPEDLLTMKIKVPSWETQNRIAHIFTELDTRIRKSEAVLEALQKGKKQLLSSLFV